MRWIRYFENSGEPEISRDIAERFGFVLNPRGPEPFVTDRQAEKACMYLKEILDWEYMQAILKSLPSEENNENEEFFDEFYS